MMAYVIIFLVFALFAGTGYWLMGRVDEYLGHHVVSQSEGSQEKQQYESSGNRKRAGQAHSRVPVIVHIQR